ncbi:hypothetical protein BDN70DRAFT_936339 [Pholiota conissans]|uniref:Uncharacterized protein n=1 Tax=Pholiota conissans TaxID=109636 RepID=A0A9P6CVJ3_9AGAR|nr:hypothetical protein BDN70DRAFT_936339 [Pholiota conissans]
MIFNLNFIVLSLAIFGLAVASPEPEAVDYAALKARHFPGGAPVARALGNHVRDAELVVRTTTGEEIIQRDMTPNEAAVLFAKRCCSVTCGNDVWPNRRPPKPGAFILSSNFWPSATSNAPNTKRKRRLSDTEREAAEDEEKRANAKKARGESAAASDHVALIPSQADTQEVKEVTKGVDEVTLDSKDEEAAAGRVDKGIPASTSASEKPVAPESVPLPEDTPGDFLAPISAASSESNSTESVEATTEEPTTISVDEASDIASSSGDAEDADGESVPDAEPEAMVENVAPSKKPISIVKTTIHAETAAQA